MSFFVSLCLPSLLQSQNEGRSRVSEEEPQGEQHQQTHHPVDPLQAQQQQPVQPQHRTGESTTGRAVKDFPMGVVSVSEWNRKVDMDAGILGWKNGSNCPSFSLPGASNGATASGSNNNLIPAPGSAQPTTTGVIGGQTSSGVQSTGPPLRLVEFLSRSNPADHLQRVSHHSHPGISQVMTPSLPLNRNS